MEEALREENRLLKSENELLKEEIACLKLQARTDNAELVALRDKVRRLNNESMAQRAATLSRNSPPPEKTNTFGRSSNRGDALVQPLTLVADEAHDDNEEESVKSPRGGFFRHFGRKAALQQAPPSPRSASDTAVSKLEPKGPEAASPPHAPNTANLAAAAAGSPVAVRPGNLPKQSEKSGNLPKASSANAGGAAASVMSSETGSSGSISTLPANVSFPTIARGANASLDFNPGFSVSILSSIRVGKNMFFLLGFRRSKGEDFVIVPRVFQDFRDLHALLVREFGEVLVPELKKLAGSEKENQVNLQSYLDHLLNYEATCLFPPFCRDFLDPKQNPSFYTLTEVLKATKHGKLQVIVPSSKSWKQHSCALLDNLYIFRNDDDLRAAETLDLEWITIEIVTVKQEPSPPVVFKIVDLLQSTETFLGCDSTKEVGEWILALRQAKTRKKGEGFWVGAESSSSAPEIVSTANVEANAVVKEWIEKPDSFSVRTSAIQMAKILDATPIPVNFDQELSVENEKTVLMKSKEKEEAQMIAATRQHLLALLLSVADDEAEKTQIVAQAAKTEEKKPVVGPLDKEKSLEEIYAIFGETEQIKFEDVLSKSPRGISSDAVSSPVRSKPLPSVPKEQHLFGSMAFVEQFLLVYRLFLGPNELLLTIVQRFLACSASENSIRLRCCAVLQKLVQSLRETIAAQALPVDERAAKLWLKSAPKPQLPDMYQRNTFDFIDLNPVEVARQLTILENQLFVSISSTELLNQCWNKEEKEIAAPNVMRTIRRFNQMSGWITSLIVKVKPMKPRVALVRRFIDIADCCMQLNNFNSVVEIVSGLQTTAVRRLTETFENLPSESSQILEKLRDFLETRKNWEKYRQRLAALPEKVPCVPYLGLYLTDLTMIDEAMRKTTAHPAFDNVKLLNWERASRIAAIHAEIRRFQQERYRLQSISYLQEYLSRLDQLSEEDCYGMSLELQPKKAT